MDEIAYPILGDEKNLPLFVIGLGKNYDQIHIIRNDGFPYNQILFSIEGEGEFILDGKKYKIKKSQAFFIPKNTPHEYNKVTNKWDTFWIVFDGDSIENLMDTLGFKKTIVCNIHNFELVMQIFNNIFDVVKKADFYSGFHSSTLLYTLIIELNKQKNICCRKNDKFKNLQLQPIIDYIELNYRDDITLEELSSILSFSPQYICRIFKECLNIRPFEYITKIRITHAKLMLLDTDLSLTEIADLVGYKDCSYFCAIFKRHEKISPNEFRNLYRKYYKNPDK